MLCVSVCGNSSSKCKINIGIVAKDKEIIGCPLILFYGVLILWLIMTCAHFCSISIPTCLWAQRPTSIHSIHTSSTIVQLISSHILQNFFFGRSSQMIDCSIVSNFYVAGGYSFRLCINFFLGVHILFNKKLFNRMILAKIFSGLPLWNGVKLLVVLTP